jgi:hypothetical protein
MGRSVLLDLGAWAEQVTLPPTDRASVDRFSVQLYSLIDDVRRERPVEGTQAEETALRSISSLGFSISRALGTAFLQVLRGNVNEALTDLVRKEFEVSEPERKLALRHIEHAVHTFGVLMESIGGALAQIPPASAAALFDELADLVRSGDVPMSDTDRIVLRFQLDLMVALDVLDASLEELTFWAYRAITGARRVEANPNALNPTGFRGELARIRARRSWMNWDQATIAKELAPWPTRSQ